MSARSSYVTLSYGANRTLTIASLVAIVCIGCAQSEESYQVNPHIRPPPEMLKVAEAPLNT